MGEGARMDLGIGCSMRAGAGQSVCGDRCGWWISPERIVMAVSDGLGHGVYASELAMACIGSGLDRPFEEIFAACDRRLRGTHGVALAVAVVDRK